MNVHEFINETNWTQKTLACDSQGEPVICGWVYSKTACKWCFTGMILLLYNSDTQWEIISKVRKYLEADPKKQPSAISRWNDDPARTWEDVRALALQLGV